MSVPAEIRRRYLMKLIEVWPRRTTSQHFRVWTERYQDRPFIIMPHRQMTYRQTWDRAWQLAKSLLAYGIRRREHVALLMSNDPDFVALWIALSLVGAVAVPLNTQLLESELAYILKQSDSRILIFHESVGHINHARTIASIWDKWEHTSQHSALEQVIIIPTQDDFADMAVPLTTWEAFVQSGKNIGDHIVQARWDQSHYPDEVAAIIYTSGTTGTPKGVMLTHDNFLRCAYSTCLSRAFEDGQRIFTPLPLYHVFALEEGVLALSFVGGTLIMQSQFHPAQALELMSQYQVNDALLVPSMLISLLNQKAVDQYDWSHLYSLMCAAAPAPVPIWQKSVDVFGLSELCTGYGGTEVTASTTHSEVTDSIEQVVSTVGRIKPGGVSGLWEYGGANVEYKVINPKTGQDLPPGSTGELTVRGNIVSRGYYRKPDETAQSFDKDGWFRSGDLGRIDEHGYIKFLGRSKDLFKVSGENVSPTEVEDVLTQHPAIKQAYVVGVPDPITGEIGAAFVELNSNRSATRKELRDWCQSELARFKIPRYIFFVQSNEWPLTGSGKIQKFQLREKARKLIEARVHG